MQETPLCPTCGCSLVRLGIARSDATTHVHDGRELLFCCQGCLDLFQQQPDQYLAEFSDWVVCPNCLAEKPKRSTIAVEHEGEVVHLCRCPYCLEAFQKDPDGLLRRLAA